MHTDMNGTYWWKTDKDSIYQEVFAFLGHLENEQAYRTQDNLRYARLYGNYEMIGMDAHNYSRVETSYFTTHRVTLNVIQSMIDTVVSKITKNKVKPMFLTDNGEWDLQQKAKKLTKFVEGVFYDCDYQRASAKAFKDACIFGTGAVKVFTKNGQVKAERAFIEELKIDDVEGYYGEPRGIHQVKYIHKDVLKGMFPDKAAKIEEATTPDHFYSSSTHNMRIKDMIMVAESWRLPSGQKQNDGIHTITISNCTLFHEEYTEAHFPFVFHRWSERPVGFFGQGLAEQLQGVQLEINKILRTIQVSMHLVSIPKLLVEAGSKIVTAHLNNKIGGIIKYAGTPPVYQPLGGIPPELFSHLDRLYQRAYEIAGVSQLSAQSQKPAGLSSGKAIRIYSDKETERFQEVAARYEESFITAAKLIVKTAKKLYEESKDLEIAVKGQDFIEKIKWEDVDIEEDQYMLNIFPTSALANDPSGRLSDVQELIQAGFISQEDGLRLLDFPDLRSVTNLYNAPGEDIDRMIDQMINTGEYESPEPYQDLEFGKKRCNQAYLKFKSQNAPEERLELLRQWIADAEELQLRAQAPAPMPAGQAQMPVDPAMQAPIDSAAVAANQVPGVTPEEAELMAQTGAGPTPEELALAAQQDILPEE